MISKPDHAGNSTLHELSEKLLALEQRVKKLELNAHTDYPLSKMEVESESDGLSFKFYGKGNLQLESHFGEYGLAWLGNIVLFFGITFFVQYLQINSFKIISSFFGFASVIGIFFLAYYLQNSNFYMAKIFKLNAYILVYYVTLKLHFFNDNPIISNETVSLTLLIMVSAVFLFLSIRKKYASLAGLSIILLTVTAILSDSTHVMLSLATILSILGVVLLYKYGWIRLVFLSIFMAYTIILFWMINNPLMGHQMQIVSNHQYSYLYIYAIAAIFSLIALMPPKEESYSSVGIIGSILLNGLGFVFLISLLIYSFFSENYILPSGLIAFYCIVYSFILKLHSKWQVTAALYALFGFVTLSICIYAYYGFPRAYFLLAIQSLLVVSMAIWFRSKFIVIMNSLLFITLLMVYLSTSAADNTMNISFSFVALATARILNWKKERLTIRTEFIRNFYLLIAFPMVLYTLYHFISNQYITLSWTMLALLYFVLSIILKNTKYRYMALGSMIAAALYLFIIDLARIELIFRVFALLFLSLISIGLSLYYTKKIKKKVV